MHNYFVVERNGQWVEFQALKTSNGEIGFEGIADMSYSELKTYEHIEEFVVGVMDAANQYFKSDDEQTLITLVGHDNCFVWGILMGPADNEGELKYMFIDWQKDGKKYKYENN